MVKVKEIYEISLYPAEWNSVVKQFQVNQDNGKGTLLERNIAGTQVKCEMTGYSWNGAKKPASPLKQRIKIQVTEIVKVRQN